MKRLRHDDRLTGVDLARAIAILAVIWVHTTDISSGAYGVQLFFMISGFLLAEFGDDYTAGRFILKRFLRLFPLSILMTVFFISNYSSVFELFLSLLLVNGLFTGIYTFPGAWSISSEWIYSWLNLTLRKLNFRSRVCIIITLSLFGILIDSYCYLTNSTLGSFQSFGYLISYFSFFLMGNILRTQKRPELPRIMQRKTFLCIVLIPLFGISTALPQIFYLLLLTIIFSTCLQMEFHSSVSKRLIHFIGKRTYGIFCGHFIILYFLDSTELLSSFQENFGAISQFLLFILILLISLLIGSATYKCIERPFIRLSHKVKPEQKKS